MRIAVDIMGGDHAPQALIEGALSAAKKHSGWQFILVGQEAVITAIGELPANVSTHYAEETVAMDESVKNLLKKRNSSIWVATKMVKDGEADAIISAGSTGVQMAAAVLLLGKADKVLYPAIATVLPTGAGPKVFIDVGANVDSTAEVLCQFALMGDIYAKTLLNIENPVTVLLSNGTEEHKGNKVTIEAHEKLKDYPGLVFDGNREGRDIVRGNFDVMVSDGFAGNIAIKTIEGTGEFIFSLMKEKLLANPIRKIGTLLIKPALKELNKTLDYHEYGGAPLVGLSGISIVCHGSSNARAIESAIEIAAKCIETGFNEKIAETLANI